MAALPAAIMACMSTSSPRLAAAAALAVASGLAAVPAAHASTVLDAAPGAPTRVAAYDGTVMWSQLDAATGKYRLVKSVGGAAPVAVGVAERAGAPFDIDLGTNRSADLYAVYTRDGDLFRLRVATGVEEKLSKLSSPTHAERDPSIQRGEIAFIRRAGGRDQVRLGNTTSGSKGSRLVRSAAHVESVELGISHLAYVVRVPGASFGRSDVHVRTIRTGRDRTVYSARSGGANAAHVTKPSFMDDLSGFVWARTNNGSGAGNRVVRYALKGGRLTTAPGSPRYATGAWAGAALGFAASTALDPSTNAGCADGGKEFCSVLTTGPLTFGS
jgi:hypothetical protein